MPVKVRCPGCKKVLNAPDKARGKVLKCPKCESRIKVPSGEGDRPSSKSREAGSSQKRRRPAGSKPKRKRQESSTSFLANLDLDKAEAKGIRICPKCHAEVTDDELIDCEECGADLETGGKGVLQRKRKSIKGVDPKLYYKGAISDAFQFYKRNIKLTLITCVSMLISVMLQLSLFYASLLCVGYLPKGILLLIGFVSGMIPYGWTWVLSLEIIKNAMNKQEKMHKVTFDIFLSASTGLKFWLWILVFPIPFYFLAAGAYVWFSYIGYPIIGLSMVCVAVAMGFALAPVTGAHLLMPITYRAWLVNNQLKVLTNKPGPLLYWMAILLITMAPAIAGLAYVGVAHGKEVYQILHDTSENTIIAAAAAYEKPKVGEADEVLLAYKGKQEISVDSSKLYFPASIILFSVFWVSIMVVINMRTAGRYVSIYQKELDLITQKKEIVYIKHEVDEFGKSTSQVKNVYMLMLLHVVATTALGILVGPFMMFVPLGLISAFVVWLPIAGLWKTFEKAGFSGQAALFPPLAAINLARIADESDVKGILLLVPGINFYLGYKMCLTIATKLNRPKGYGIALFLLFPLMIYLIGNDETAQFPKKKKSRGG